jgi:hypothetical protein
MDEVSRKQFINILVSHGIQFFISKAGRIIALDSYDLSGKEYFEDITDYSFKQLKAWLGY